MTEFTYKEAFNSRTDLKEFKSSALALFALQLKFAIEDISSVALNSITEGPDDKKADLIYIDSENHVAVISQSYICENEKEKAPANKASDLNTAITWLFNRNIENLPEGIRSHASELRQSIKDGNIETLHIWYIHNLNESKNVSEELKTVEHTAYAAIASLIGKPNDIEICALEVGNNVLEEWYKSILTPILITDSFKIKIEGGFEIKEDDWSAFVTSIPAKWLHEQFNKYGSTKLFSANVREYLGSRNTDKNINKGIQKTATNDASHFWVFNNGITALVNDYVWSKDGIELTIKGISIVNGAQTTGAVGTSSTGIDEKAKLQIRFIKCKDVDTVQNIVRFNNSQNKINASDFRSNDPIQRRLIVEFEKIPEINYLNRRGGGQDIIKRRPNSIPSISAGQILAAFHGDPDAAYNKKTHIWESDTLYSRFFNEKTSAKHIFFVFSLLKSIEKRKLLLLEKNKKNELTKIEEDQLSFFRNRG